MGEGKWSLGGCYVDNAMEMNVGLRTDSESGQHSIGDGAEGESRVEEEANKSFNDTEMTPCVATEFMDGESESVFYDVKVTEEVFNETELVCSVDILSNDSKLVYESHTNNDAKTISCSEAHLRESVDYAANDYFCNVELEHPLEDHKTEILEERCGKDMARKAPNEGHKRPKGVLNNSEMGPCADNHALEQLDDGKIELYSNSYEVKEVQNNPDLGTYHKDEVKEPTNDDLHS